MKKILSILLVVVILMSILVSCKIDGSNSDDTTTTTTTTSTTTNKESPPDPPEDDKYSKGLDFALNDDGQSYSVTGIGTCADVDIVIPSTYNGLPVTNIADAAFAAVDLETGEFIESPIISVVIPNSVISIGSGAFAACTYLKYVEIPDSVTSIGESAFLACTSITNIDIPDSVTSIDDGTFTFCTSLASIDIPDSVTSIAGGAFSACLSLTSVVVGNSVNSIGDDAFASCNSLVEVINTSSLNIVAGSSDYGNIAYYAKQVVTDESQSAIKIVDDCVFYDDGIEVYLIKYIGDDADVIIPEYDGGKEYGLWDYAFYFDAEITSIIIPDSVTSIGDYAFFECTSLTSIVIGDSVTSIGDYAFAICDLITVTIPDSVTSIGEAAFLGCISLTSVVIGESVTSISDSAFIFNPSIIEVINKSSLDIVAGSSSNGYIASNAKYIVTDGSPSGIKIEGDYVFYDNGTDVYLVKYLGSETEVTLPEYDGGKEYGVYGRAFDIVDNAITTMNIPASVTIFDEYAFYNCSSLTNINFEGTIEQWNDIVKNSYWDYTLEEYTISCTDGEFPQSAQ